MCCTYLCHENASAEIPSELRSEAAILKATRESAGE
jgi:hypothetical protein